MKKIVLALGGNALQAKGEPATAEAQLKIVQRTARHIVGILEEGNKVAIVHGNGPQVGRIVLQNEAAKDITPPMPLDVCGAMSEGMIGYHIQQALRDALKERHIDIPVTTIISQVVVDGDDSAFSDPSKPIGPFYSAEEAGDLAQTKHYVMKEDSGRGYRRVVASPLPKRIVEIESIRTLLDAGHIVISLGGGGIPVIEREDGVLEGAGAVIDKDFAAEKLAEDIDSDYLVILTAVDNVYIDYGTDREKALSNISAPELKKYAESGQFAPGSMLPKVQAAIKFAESGQGRKAVITSLENIGLSLDGAVGTEVAC